MGLLDPPGLSKAQASALYATPGNFKAADGEILRLAALTTNNACKYMLNTYWPTAYPGTGTITDFGGTSEPNIRPPAAAAYTVAAALATGKYDAAVTGVAAAAAKTATLRIVNGLVSTHLANGGTWGGPEASNPSVQNFQEGLWAFTAGCAGYLLWSDLSTGQQDALKAMVAWEAKRVVDWPIWPIWKTTAGVESFVGDGKSEETAWWASILALAVVVDPSNSNNPAYRLQLARMALYQYAVPADLADTTPVNGLVPQKVLTGTNVNADGSVVNHGRIHPTYTVSANLTVYAALSLAGRAGVTLPAAMMRNAPLVWQSLTKVDYTPGVVPSTYPAGGAAITPGGSVYGWPANQTLYAPQTNDWGAQHGLAETAAFDVQAYRYGWDKGSTPGAQWWAAFHLGAQLALQQRFSTGQTYPTGNFTEDNYGSPDSNPREAIAGAACACALLTITAPAYTRDWSDLASGATPVAWATKVAATGPVLWWKMSETAGGTFADSSGGGHAGTYAGFGTAGTYATASIVAGDPAGASFTCAGGSRIRNNTSVPTWLPGDRTFAVAMKRAGIPAANEWIFGQAGGTGTNRIGTIRVNNTTGYAVAEIWNAAGTNSILASTVNVCDGNPHLLVLTITKGGAILYVDGVAVAQSTMVNPYFGAGDGVAAGCASDSGNPFNGVIDEATAWARALHASDVADLYRAFKAA